MTVSGDDDADVVVAGAGIPIGTLLVYDLRRGISALGLCGLELGTSVDVEHPEYSGLGWWIKLESSSGATDTA